MSTPKQLKLEAELIHGLAGTYTNHYCRCDKCTVAHREANSSSKRKRDRSMAHKHGTNYIYNDYSCRCELCKAAHAQHNRDYRLRRKQQQQQEQQQQEQEQAQ